MEMIKYAIRNIPPHADKIIRLRAKQSGKSINKTVIDMLILATSGTNEVSDKYN